MASPASSLQLAANRANAQLSTGPRTEQGRIKSSFNACSHGLTSQNALLPGEDEEQYQAVHRTYREHYRPQSEVAETLVAELVDIKWRLRRVPLFEAQLIKLEVYKLETDPELRPLIENIEGPQVFALAYARLIERKVLTNLAAQEGRLGRRLDKIQRQLESLPPPPRQRPGVVEPAPPPPRPQIEIQKNEPISVNPQPGRNQPCPCNSGLKFKRCCLDKTPAAQPQPL